VARLRVAFVYPNSRRGLIAEWRRGEAPDTHLLGLNQLGAFGIDAEAREPALDTRLALLPKRIRWHLRELPLPWELRDADLLFTPLANLVPLTAALRRRPPVLVFNFGFNTILRRAGRARRSSFAAALGRAAGVVCLGPSQRDELLELAPLDPDRVQVATHGVDTRFYAPSDGSRAPLVLAVGKDLARDYATLVEAARGVDARFVFVVLSRNLDGIDLPGNVEARAHIPYSELRELYGRATCAIVALRDARYPYGSEGSGVSTMLEAQAMATPLVATDRPIVRDYVGDGETALIVPPEDPGALREAIERLLGDRELAERLGRAGRRRVEDRHTMDDMAAALAPLMKEAASA
jgi:glycosyltransferase involved in cell wall biosynthesis